MSTLVETRRIQVRAGLVEQVGQPYVDVPVATDPDSDDAAALRARLAAACPALAEVLAGCLLVAGDRVLGDEEAVPADIPLALVPPMRGG